MTPPTCEGCAFWDVDGRKVGYLDEARRCRRYPPTALSLPPQHVEGYRDEFPTVVWPHTYENDTCGEFKARA